MTTAQPPIRELPAPTTLGLATREAFRRSANELLDDLDEGEGRLVVDLSGTKEVDSSGLGALVMVQRHAADRRQQVVLRGVSAELEFLLVLTKLDDLFLFESSRPNR